MSQKQPNSLRIRLYSNLEIQGSCLIWIGQVHKRTGYGLIHDGTLRRKELVHRVAWKLEHGSIPDDLQVLHQCDVKLCANEDHLYLGTALNNIHDALDRKRFYGNPKLTLEQVQAIRDSTDLAWKIAKRFGLRSVSTVRNIKSGYSWK